MTSNQSLSHASEASESPSGSSRSLSSPSQKDTCTNVVLLGSEGSGKTTIFKQVALLNGKVSSRTQQQHEDPIASPHSRLNDTSMPGTNKLHAPLIRKQCIHDFCTLAHEASRLSLLSHEMAATAHDLISTLHHQYNSHQLDVVAGSVVEGDQDDRALVAVMRQHKYMQHTMLALWHSEAMQTAYGDCKRQGLVMDSTQYFLDNLERVLDPSFIPTDTEVLQAYSPTTSTTFTNFANKRASFR